MSALRKNVAGQHIKMQVNSRVDGSPITAGVSVNVTIDAGVQAAGTGTATHLGNGQWDYAPTQAETNGASIGFQFTATNAIYANAQCFTIGYDPTQAQLPANTTQLAGQTVTAAAGVTFPSSVSSFSGGAVASVTAAVTVGTNNDKTGYSLTQAFPTNFSSLAITAGGAVTAGTVSDKTGYSLSQAFPTNFGALVVDVNGRVQVQYGTAIGQISATSGVVDANAKQINGSAPAASNLAGGLNTVASGTVGSSATTTSIPTSAFTPSGAVTDQFKGRTLIFADNTTTAALQGQGATITGSTGAANPTLTVSALTTAPAAGDTFWIF